MNISFPGESTEYRAARDRLLEREIELRRVSEEVAAERRKLPPGGMVPEDYVFQGAGADGAPMDMKLSDLFAPDKNTLVIYSFMYGPDMEEPCPMCASFLDSLDAAAEHIGQRINLVVVAKSPLSRILAFAHERGWRRLRLLSSADNNYNNDYFGENEEGSQEPMLNVFQRDGTTIRHFWGSELMFAPTAPGQDPRHVDFLSPLWNLFDFAPEGRGTDWYPRLSYA